MLRIFSLIFFIITVFVNNIAIANNDVLSSILSMEDRADFIDDITQKRVDTLLPRLMAETDWCNRGWPGCARRYARWAADQTDSSSS